MAREAATALTHEVPVATRLKPDIKERIFRFKKEVVSVGGQVVPLPDLIAVQDYVTDLAITLNYRRIALSSRLPSRLFPSDVARQRRFEIADQATMRREQFFDALKIAEIGVSTVDLGVAETGTLVMAASDEMERLVTALPPTHVAVLPRSRLVDSLADALTYISGVLKDRTTRGTISLISGVSSTADIGGLVVSGVHGPKFLHVCLLDQELGEST